jgi:hypothetical protein
MLMCFLKSMDVYDEYQKVITLYQAMEPLGQHIEEP